MSLYSIIITNNYSGCTTEIEQQFNVTECTKYNVTLPRATNSIGPFNVYVNSTGGTPVFSAVTRNELIEGVEVFLGICP